MRSIPCGRETFGFNYHPRRKLSKSVLIFLLIQRFLCPFLDKGGIPDLFPPIGFLPNRIREGTHPHFDNLTPGSVFRSGRGVSGQKRETAPFLGVPYPHRPHTPRFCRGTDGCSVRLGRGRSLNRAWRQVARASSELRFARRDYQRVLYLPTNTWRVTLLSLAFNHNCGARALRTKGET